MDSRVKNSERLPLGIKALNERLCVEVQREMDQDDWDSWSCKEGLAFTIKKCQWYQFYDCVEVIGEELQNFEPFYECASGETEVLKFSFGAYRSRVNELFAKHQIGWRLNTKSQLESALPKDLSDRIDSVEKMLDQYEAAREHFRKAKRYGTRNAQGSRELDQGVSKRF
jgi:hypothetical protein